MAIRNHNFNADVPLPKAGAIRIMVPWCGFPVELSCVGQNSYSSYLQVTKWTAHLIRAIGDVPAGLAVLTEVETQRPPDALTSFAQDVKAALEDLLGYEVARISTAVFLF